MKTSRMHLIGASLAIPLTLVVSSFSTSLFAQADGEEAVKGLVKVIELDQSGAALIRYCAQAAPATVPRLKADWQRWRERAEVEKAMAVIGPAEVARIQALTQSSAERLVDEIRRRGPAAEYCPDLSGWLDQGPFNTPVAFPAYHARLRTGGPFGAAPKVATAGPPASSGQMVAGDVRAPGATFYTPTQLDGLIRNWRGTAQDRSLAYRNMGAAMPIIIQGKLVPYRDSVFIEDNDGVFRSKQRISLMSFSSQKLAAYTGKTITVRGRFKELPGSLAYLYDAEVLDPAGLVPSPLSGEGGRTRVPVREDQVMAAEGGGVPAAQIHGLLFRSYSKAGGGFAEDMLLLLKDGSYYDGQIAPVRLDLAKSRRMQPDKWGKWRMQGGGYQIQPFDDEGRAKEWRAQPGAVFAGWRRGQTLSGTFTHKAFNGSIVLGGVYSERRYRFSPDGRFELIGFSRGSSGSMAGAGGFTGSATRYSDGKGSRASAGGGNGGAFASSQSRGGDGADSRGTYMLDGYAITLRFDDGNSATLLSAPWTDADKIIVGDGVYSRG